MDILNPPGETCLARWPESILFTGAKQRVYHTVGMPATAGKKKAAAMVCRFFQGSDLAGDPADRTLQQEGGGNSTEP